MSIRGFRMRCHAAAAPRTRSSIAMVVHPQLVRGSQHGNELLASPVQPTPAHPIKRAPEESLVSMGVDGELVHLRHSHEFMCIVILYVVYVMSKLNICMLSRCKIIYVLP